MTQSIRNLRKGLIIATVLLSFYGRFARAEEKDGAKGVVAGGVVFNIASDRRVQPIGGIVQPEPLDVYLKRFLDGISERLDRLEKKVDAVIVAVHANPIASGPPPNQK